jgi:hypothetical protein
MSAYYAEGAIHYDKIADLDDNKNYKVRLLCGDCHSILNETREMTGKEIKTRWTMLVMGSGFVAGKCKEGCRSTFSDLNINTSLSIFEVQ